MKINTYKIRKEMKRQGLSVHDLAVKMDVREAWIYAILSGKDGKTFNTVEKFAKALKVPEKELIK